MPRAPRVHFPGALFHVMARGVGGRDLYLDSADYLAFLNLIAEVKEALPFKLYAYCLMSNHFHLLLQELEATSSMIMHNIMSRYAHFFRKRRQWVGHLFQSRYKAILCNKDSYLLELLRYIPLNPVRANIVKDPAAWQWSSHRNYLQGRSDGLVDTQMPLALFSQDETRAVRRYEEFVLRGLPMGHRSDRRINPSHDRMRKIDGWRSRPCLGRETAG